MRLDYIEKRGPWDVLGRAVYCNTQRETGRLNEETIPRGKTISDPQIIQLIRDGHTEAYADLVRQYHKRVMGYCFSMLANHSEAEEAAQDVFVKAYRSLGKFKGDSSFSTWLYRITANHCLDVLRKRNRRRTVSLDALLEQDGNRVQEIFSETATFHSRLEDRQLADKILSTLPSDYRTILTLREADGLEYQEIADTLKCSLDAVKGRLARARKQLMTNLQHLREVQDVHTYRKPKDTDR
jgi:RNA polymerase sigma-70 factor (ECF subfamily)